ncbi:MAG: chemotaxis protein CheX, partial [Terriglobales bacterium]
MTTSAASPQPPDRENWLAILERSTQEVFEIVLGCQLTPVAPSQEKQKGGFTAIVGLAGALCGVVTVCCGAQSADQIAKGMLGEPTVSPRQIADALGEICNMVAGNFKNKLA